MDEFLRLEVVKKTCASIYLGCLSEYKRNLGELRRSWQNSLKRHEASKPSIAIRILTNGAAMQAWVDRRNALEANVASCDMKIRRIEAVIATGSGSPEVAEYVEALAGQVQAVDSSDHFPARQSTMLR